MANENTEKKQQATTENAQDFLTGEVSEDLHPLLLWLTKNVKMVSLVCLALILVFGGFAAYDYFQAQSRVTAANELGKILVTTNESNQLEALEAYVKSVPASMEVRGLFELASASIRDKNFADADGAWVRLKGKVDPTLQAVPALGRVQALAMDGKNDDALAILKELQKSGLKTYIVSINSTLGALAEQAGDYATARDAYKALLAANSGQSRTKAYYEHKVTELSEKVENKNS